MTKKTEPVFVVICPGRTLQHNGEAYGPTRRVSVSSAEAARLVSLGTAVRLCSLTGPDPAAEKGAGEDGGY